MKRIYSFGVLRQVFVAAVLLGLACMGFSQTTLPVAPRIVQPIDEHQLVSLPGTSSLAKVGTYVAVAPDSLPLEKMTLMLKRTDAQEADLSQLLDQQQDTSSPMFHKWLTPTEFGLRFGIAQEDLKKTTAWLESHGFKVDTVWPGENFITFSGNHAQFKNAFHSEMHSYTMKGKQYWASASAPMIPAALAQVISGFTSLDNYHPHPMHGKATEIRRDKNTGQWQRAETPAKQEANPLFNGTMTGQSVYAVSPYDFAKIYNVQPLWDEGVNGTGQTIAIVAASDINTADVDYFRSVFNLPATKLNKIYYGPNPGTLGGGYEAEADLDVEWSGAVAKNATIDLVIAGDTNVESGANLAAMYAVASNVAPILSVSWSECERNLTFGSRTSPYTELWRQAAAQGITVTVASGDFAADGCSSDPYLPPLSASLQVNGLASTPYNVAVGGTDLYGTYTAKDASWDTKNDPTTKASALKYIPELPWNDSCGNKELLAVLQSKGLTTDPTTEALCSELATAYASFETVPHLSQYLNVIGGGGGASNAATCTSKKGSLVCAGYPKPAWQTGVPGIPTDGVRDLPDVSLMAGDGLWGSFYVYCQSDGTSAGYCDIDNHLEGAGGTSFGTPAFAGMIALIQQKIGASRLGNPNSVLYSLAASQYTSGLDCNSSSVGDGNSCVFYDVQQGGNAVPCQVPQPRPCFGKICPPPPPSVCHASQPYPVDGSLQYAVTDGWYAGSGYDLATGLGSINAYNLVHNWNSAVPTYLPSITTVTSSSPSFPYGSAVNLTVTVAPASSGAGTPTGDVSVTIDPTGDYSKSNGGPLTNGTLPLQAFQGLQGGTYQVVAHYSGDTTFARGDSAPLQITITPVEPSVTVTSNKQQLTAGDYVTFFVQVATPYEGMIPTGTATFKNITTGQVLGDTSLVPLVGTTQPTSNASFRIASSQLATGGNSISITYNGDNNYLSETQTGSLTYNTPYSVAVSPANVTLDLSAGKSVSATVTVATSNGATLYAPYLNFACPNSLPSGLTCSFSAPAAGPSGTFSSVLTLTAASNTPAMRSAVSSHPVLPVRNEWLWVTGMLVGFVMVGGGSSSKKARAIMMTLVVIGTVAGMIACGGSSSKQNVTPTQAATTVVLTASSATPALNSSVTLTAAVAPASGTGTPTGTITFLDGTTTLATANVANGKAMYSSSALAVGPHPVTAKYSGDSSFASSASSSVNVDVTYTSTLAINVTDTTTGFSTSANVGITLK